ncbi:hypothetical protein MCOR27_010509 [Pyricularia oryzae]|uniref:Rhodopsin domain-containing protein n=2 Tax=Pyricularia TaxID=48558 RepID=A0ABQ8NPI5_PYRGI|nr:hypothetical protein MCOR01_004375 [Pyricularia oryzae]KAI6299670.1 hypothetical protein MCOR33_004478 [Pyricularia grisea]KAH9431057.1 hypothetical protein MCOR02_008366 [Pyricularia oryzae]KAI6263567.1 hypothetical protein MCOR19_000204 [Pyricularia oryzae]KAI6267644.1 hypothetical protein MCOR27_010509 [Pyricularia oryzae]
MASLYSFLATHVSVRQTTGGQPGAGPPGGPPGGGIDPSLLPHDDRGGLVLAVIWTFIPLSGIFLGLRLYCRQWKRLQVFWDDIFLIAAWLLLLVDASLTTYVVKLGYGKHAWDVPFENVDAQALIGLICTTLAITSAAWSKTSFALTLLRIAGKRVKIVIYFLIFSMNTLMGVGALLMWVNCKPLRKAWQPMIEGYCWDRQLDVIFGIFSGSYSGISDLALALLPWTIILKLQMKTREKFGIALAMSMGVFAAICAFIKCSFLPTMASHDFTYDGVPLVIWGTVEVAITVIAASIPVLRVLFRDIASSRGYFQNGKGTGEQKSAGRQANASLHQNRSRAGILNKAQPPQFGSSAHCTVERPMEDSSSTAGLENSKSIPTRRDFDVDSESFEMSSIHDEVQDKKHRAMVV